MKRELFGPRSERTARLLDQMELQLEELATTASEDEIAAEQAAAKARTTTVSAFTRKRPSRKPFPEHLPRERVMIAASSSCACCGGSRLSKLGEDVTETLESIPLQWKVIEYVRERFLCRDCESINQAPAPFGLGRPQSSGDARLRGSSVSISRSIARPSATPGRTCH